MRYYESLRILHLVCAILAAATALGCFISFFITDDVTNLWISLVNGVVCIINIGFMCKI